MKNMFKFIGIAAFCAALCFSMAACDEYTDDEAVTFSSVIQDGSTTQTTTRLILVFNGAIKDLTVNDITLSDTSIVKKTLSPQSGTYFLDVTVSASNPSVSVTVKKDGYAISGNPKTVAVYNVGSAAVTFNSVTANGSSSQTTTELSLTFSAAITGLAAADITLSGVSNIAKGTVTGSNPYILPISGFTSGGTVTVAVAKTGYTISDSSRTVAISYAGSATVTFNSVTVSPASGATTALSLSFSAAITGLNESDITLSGVSGINKGALSVSGTTYTLPISGFTASGIVTVTVSKTGYNISGSPKTVNISPSMPITFNSVTADGLPGESTTKKLTLQFSGTIPNLSDGDIILSDLNIDKAEIEGANPYYLPISGFTSDKTITVSVAKAGYNITGSPKSVSIYYVTPTITGFGEFKNWLEKLPTNNAASAYRVMLNLGSLSTVSSVDIGNLLKDNPGKYVNLNLSGSTFTSIGASAFSGCTSLTGITIPGGVGTIGNGAFSGCTSLASVSFIGNSVESIGVAAFLGCSSLNGITIPGGVKSIGGTAFYGCTSLAVITIPDSVEEIAGSAFYGCTSLLGVNFMGNAVTSIGASAFYGCSKLASVSIGEKVTSIGASAFSGCASLASVTFMGDEVTEIGQEAFYGCASLISINIPEDVAEIGASAFYGCASLTSVTFNGNKVTKIMQDTFSGCASLISINIPENVDGIGASAFSGCTKLVSVDFLGNEVKSIGASAFVNCSSLGSISISNAVKSIGDSAFANCTALLSVTFSSAPDTFTSLPNNAFPGNLVDKYKASSGSSPFTFTRDPGSQEWT